jgi:hypothetical protein
MDCYRDVTYHDVVLAGPRLAYRRRNAALSAVVPMFHLLSATLIATHGYCFL